MTKQTITLNKDEFKGLVTETVKHILNEIGYRAAALPHGANYNAMKSKVQNSDSNAVSKNGCC